MRFALSVSILFVLFPISVAKADIINVPADQPTIQAGINAAVNGDSVLVAPGTYMENIDFKQKAITVQSEQGPDVTTIDGNQAGVTAVISGTDSMLEGFTITNGQGTWGAGVYCYQPSGGSITIKRNIIHGNSSAYGGGVYCFDGATPLITENNIYGNSAARGGGIFCDYIGEPDITHNTIAGNSASDMGGGIYLASCQDAWIAYNTIKDNTNPGGIGGGGICAQQNDYPTLYSNIIRNNSTSGSGGGFYHAMTHPILWNNIFQGNTASGKGGGIYSCNGSVLETFNCTFHSNGGKLGGALNVDDSYADVNNSIFWNNNSVVGNEIYLTKGPNTTTLHIDYCDVEGGQAKLYVDPGCVLIWGAGMINKDPLFADTSEGDFHLRHYSPCRDAGDPSGVAPGLDFEDDERDALVDLGADEFHIHLYCTGNPTPGGAIKAKLVGMPGTNPVGLFIGSGLSTWPLSTMWGLFYLQPPWILFGPLGSMPASGVMVLSATLPASKPAPYDLPMQALIGLNPDSLTNLFVLEVR